MEEQEEQEEQQQPDAIQSLALMSLVDLNQQQAMLQTESTTYKIIRNVFAFLGLSALCITSYMAARIYQIRKNYSDFISWIDGPCRQDGFVLASGLNIVLSITWRPFNYFFGPSTSVNYPSAVLLCYYNKFMHQSIMDTGAPGQFLTCLHDVIGMFDVTVNNNKIICATLDIMGNEGAYESTECMTDCPFNATDVASPGMAMVKGVTSGLNLGLGPSFAVHAASATLGAATGPMMIGSMVGGIAIGAMDSMMENQKQRKALQQQCLTAKALQTCRPMAGLC